MHFAAHVLHVILVSHTCTFALDPAEQEFEELQEPAPTEEANPEHEQGKPRCIQPYPWVLFIILFWLWILIVH
jgi:hypothetical protein